VFHGGPSKCSETAPQSFAIKIQANTIHSQLCSTIEAAVSLALKYSTAIQVITPQDPVASSFLQALSSNFNFNLKISPLLDDVHPLIRQLD
jgi:hypothetical protein